MYDDLKKAVEVLKSGGIILYPTDTIWGIGCDATNVEAVKRIYEIKKRKDSKRMLILMENPALLDRYVDEVPDVAWDLVEISTTPLTVIYPGAKNLAANLIAEDGSIGIRFTKEEFTTKLLQRFRRPIVSSSANISGEKSPTCFDDVADEIKDGVDYIVEYRQDDRIPAKPSSVIKLGPSGQIDILRK
ncbi:L-threonylcarbamoyladenylate synthase [Draconibacterium sp. IB214405]|uniref:L-threonylcarbamoyladenylate synthase n=1 Tax=Draconibacterium sp. IB214405 TaxID=3097352 RepID=UPI002A0F63D4|nr:L-threonylcarbamoyladenylate synthase [Draconibacterium sp. IB214405]MDX8341589.1 L-threonylcarbamoyladenylate synthase [Draconibacterium sp. IB214405]